MGRFSLSRDIPLIRRILWWLGERFPQLRWLLPKGKPLVRIRGSKNSDGLYVVDEWKEFETKFTLTDSARDNDGPLIR